MGERRVQHKGHSARTRRQIGRKRKAANHGTNEQAGVELAIRGQGACSDGRFPQQ